MSAGSFGSTRTFRQWWRPNDTRRGTGGRGTGRLHSVRHPPRPAAGQSRRLRFVTFEAALAELGLEVEEDRE